MFSIRKKQHNEQEIVRPKDDLQTLVPITVELADVSKGIFISSRDLNECARTLAHISGEVEQNIHINQGMIQKVSEEVHSINIAAEEIYTHAKRNETLSSENLKNVEFSISDLNESIRGIEALFEYLDQVTKTLEQLQTYSDSIGNITTYIDEIASKTSIVSINASIEAARAGEAGRGFMVITDAIKDLADQSKTFSNNIGGMIGNITTCITDLNQVSKMNRERIVHTKESISTLENNLRIIAHSTSELDENIQSTLTSSEEIKQSVVSGEDTVKDLIDSFTTIIQDSKAMSEALGKQENIVGELTEINERVRHISEDQLNTVLNEKMEEKITIIAQKIGAYEGKRDVAALQRLAKTYLLNSINYINDEGCFEESLNPKALGFNIFESEPEYKRFKTSSKQIQVYPLSRNLFSGEVIRYVSIKHIRTKQLISVGFNLKAMEQIHKMTMEQIEAL